MEALEADSLDMLCEFLFDGDFSGHIHFSSPLLGCRSGNGAQRSNQVKTHKNSCIKKSSLEFISRYKKEISSLKQRVILVILWIVAFATASPLVASLIESWPFPVRYSCQVMDEYSRLYGLLVIIFFYIIPWILLVVVMIMIQK